MIDRARLQPVVERVDRQRAMIHDHTIDDALFFRVRHRVAERDDETVALGIDLDQLHVRRHHRRRACTIRAGGPAGWWCRPPPPPCGRAWRSRRGSRAWPATPPSKPHCAGRSRRRASTEPVGSTAAGRARPRSSPHVPRPPWSGPREAVPPVATITTSGFSAKDRRLGGLGAELDVDAEPGHLGDQPTR